MMPDGRCWWSYPNIFFKISLIQISISLICLVHHHRRTMADVARRQAAELKPALVVVAHTHPATS
jgi:heme exporter protein D